MSEQDCLEALRRFAPKIIRWGETSAVGMFSGGEHPDVPIGEINVQLLCKGSFGTADELFEAMRVLAGHRLPRRE